MAASEDERVPLPSVEEPEGADIPTKESGYDTADNLFYRQTSPQSTAMSQPHNVVRE